MKLVVAVVPPLPIASQDAGKDSLELRYRVTSEGHTVAVSPVDESDIARGTPCHALYDVPPEGIDPLVQPEAVFEDAVKPALVEALRGHHGQGPSVVVVDGAPLAQQYLLFHREVGLLRRVVDVARECEEGAAVQVGLVDVAEGSDGLVDALEPSAPRPPRVVLRQDGGGGEVGPCLVGYRPWDTTSDSEGLHVVESLFDPTKHQIIAITVRPGEELESQARGASFRAAEQQRFYLVSLGFGSTSQQRGLSTRSGANDDFRAELRRVAAPSRPSPSKQPALSNLLRLLHPALTTGPPTGATRRLEDTAPSVWLVALMPWARRLPRYGPTEMIGTHHREVAYFEAVAAIASARQVASACDASRFPANSEARLTPPGTPTPTRRRNSPEQRTPASQRR